MSDASKKMSEELILTESLKMELVCKYGQEILVKLNSAWKENFVRPFLYAHFSADLSIVAKDLLAMIEEFLIKFDALSKKSAKHKRGFSLADIFLKTSDLNSRLRSAKGEVRLLLSDEGSSVLHYWGGKTQRGPGPVAFGEFLYKVSSLLMRTHTNGELCPDWELVLKLLAEQGQCDYRLFDQANYYLVSRNIRALSAIIYRRKMGSEKTHSADEKSTPRKAPQELFGERAEGGSKIE